MRPHVTVSYRAPESAGIACHYPTACYTRVIELCHHRGQAERKATMAIPSASCFDYEATLTRSRSGGWTGRAVPRPNQSVHPGLVGDQPTLVLAGGIVTLRRPSPFFRSNLITNHGEHPPRVSFRVGEALEAVAQEGDLCAYRVEARPIFQPRSAGRIIW